MKRMLGLLLAVAVMVGMSMPTFAQEKGKAEAKKGTEAVEKKTSQEGDAKKTDSDTKKDAKKGEKKSAAKKGEKKDEKKEEKK
jgi:uncharacterized protein YxeA